MRGLIGIFATVFVAGCATSTVTYAPDGKAMHVIRCDGSAVSESVCFTKAGEICKERGYTVLGKNGEAAPYSYGSGSSQSNANRSQAQASSVHVRQSGMMVTRTLYVRCNA